MNYVRHFRVILFLSLFYSFQTIALGSSYISIKNFVKEKKCIAVLVTEDVKKYMCSSVEVVFINRSNFILAGTKLVYSAVPVYCTVDDCFIPEDVIVSLNAVMAGKPVTQKLKKAGNVSLHYSVEFFPLLFNLLPRDIFIRKIAVRGKPVMIDPGHGGSDPGAIGKFGTREKDLVLTLSLKLAERLRKAGFRVYLTRKGDYFVTLEERSRKSMETEPALFLSIHANFAPNPEASGVEIYYAGFFSSDIQAEKVAAMENAGRKVDRTVLKILADLILLRQIELSSQYAHIFNYYLSRLPRVHTRGVRKGPFWILLSAGVPSVLVEVGFLSNAQEERMLNDPLYQNLLVEAMFYAIVNSLQSDGRN